MFGKISKEEKEDAIQFLMDNIPKDCLKKVLVASSSPISKPPKTLMDRKLLNQIKA